VEFLNGFLDFPGEGVTDKPTSSYQVGEVGGDYVSGLYCAEEEPY